MSSTLRSHFDQALGESFGEFICPPVMFDDASPHECCEAVWALLGHDVTPTTLARLGELELRALANAVGKHFDCEPPSIDQIREAVAQTLSRWPAGSLGEST